MRIALLISGRAARYEVCLLPILENSKHQIDLFMSINDENGDCDYYKEMQQTLAKWLKKCVISKYEVPQSFIDVFKPEVHWVCLQKINNRYVPHNVLSMFYNEQNAFKLATEYADSNNIEYDYYMKYRTDIILDPNIFENLQPIMNDRLYINTPICKFRLEHSIHKVDCICHDWLWGKREMMTKWAGIYDYIFEMNNKYNGEYYIAFEGCITDYIMSNNINYETVYYSYQLDRNRRIFEKIWENAGSNECRDIRINNIPGALLPIDIRSVTNTKNIPICPE